MTLDDDTASLVEALKAQIAAIDGNVEGALEALTGKDDPESIARRLAILIDAERYDEAAKQVRDTPPDARWCEQGVLAFAASGDLARSEALVAWAHRQNSLTLWQSAVVAKSRGRYIRAWPQERAAPALPGELEPEVRDGVAAALDELSPILTAIRATNLIQNGHEATAVALALEYTYALNLRNENTSLAELLWNRTPIPLNYAYAVLRKRIPATPELVNRLRSERGGTFEASRVAALIEGTILGKPREAIAAVRSLMERYRSPEHLERIAALLDQLATGLPDEDRLALDKEIAALLGDQSRYTRLKSIEAAIKEKRIDHAESQLLKAVDEADPNWLELMALVRTHQKRDSDAVDLLQKATEIFPDVVMLRKLAIAAERTSNRRVAIAALERALRIDPDDTAVRKGAARLYTELGEYDRAAEQFAALGALRPEEVAFRVNQARSLALALKYEASLRVYDDLCQLDQPPLQAVLGRAMLFKSMDRADLGFKALESFKSAFADNSAFLQVYIDLGYSSKREPEAHWGFARLREIQAQGGGENVLREMQIDDLIAMQRQHMQDEESLNQKILSGQMPALFVGQVFNRTPIESFARRTRSLRWLAEQASYRSAFTTYSSNGFVVVGASKGTSSLEAIESAQQGSIVAVDLTSLMALHRLGLLDVVAEFFGTCLYASDYQAAVMSDRDRLVVHQPSRLEAVRDVKAAIDGRRIITLTSTGGMPYIHEHEPPNTLNAPHSYGLVDLLPGIVASGLFSDEMIQKVKEVAHKPSGVNDAHGPIGAFDNIRCDFLTLETIAQQGCLRPMLSAFKVHVSEDDQWQVDTEATGWQERQNLKEEHIAFWNEINGNSRFVSAGVSIPNEFLKDQSRVGLVTDESRQTLLPFVSLFLANERAVPLLVDDRCCQMARHNTQRSTTSAFGTDKVLEALLTTQRLNAKRLATAYLTLMNWRFRFIIPPLEILISIAKDSLLAAPGHQLRRVSRYVQECMRDPGLLCGSEEVQPPISIAHKLYVSWTNVLSNFVVSCWVDPEISEEAAQNLTSWAMTECLPAAPMGLGFGAVAAAEYQARLAMSQALVRSATLTDTIRVNRALRGIAAFLGITKNDYVARVAEVLDVIKAK
jgi:tetratricopeptide (TPR) repeat protein